MAQYKSSGLDSKALAERKSKRLEEALSAYTPEQTKLTVNKLLEDFVDESGNNYFEAGKRDTTLYFADENYIREMEKEKAKDKHKQKEKASVVGKLHKLTTPKIKNDDDFEDEDVKVFKPEKSNKPEHTDKLQSEADVNKDNTTETNIKKTTDKTEIEETNEVSDDNSEVVEEKDQQDTNLDISKENTKNDDDNNKATANDNMPEPEPTIVITPVKAEDIAKEDTKEMRREFFDNEAEIEEVPRRRRKPAEDETPVEDKKAPEIDVDDIENEDDEEDEKPTKKNKFGGFFKRKKKDDPFDDDDEFEDDDDEFEDDEFEDDDDDDNDDYYEEGLSFKKVLNIVVIIALVCSTVFFAASNYTNSKKLESANIQINELSKSNNDNTNQAETAALVENTTVATTASQITTEATTTAAESAEASGKTYIVQKGDVSGEKICKNIYGEYTPELWQKLCEANGKNGTDFIVGEEIKVP